MGAYFTIQGIAGLSLAGLCLGIIVLRSIGRSTFEYLDWSLLFIGLVFGVSAPVVLDAVLENPEKFSGAEFIFRHRGGFAPQTGAAVVAMIGLMIGWRCAGWRLDRKRFRRSRMFTGLDNPRAFARTFWGMFLIAVAAQYLYTLDYGGFLGIVDYSQLIRSGVLTEEERSTFSFLKPVAGFALIASYGYLGLLMVRSSRTVLTWIGFVVSSLFSVYVLYTWLGRLSMATFFAVMLLSLFIVRAPKRLTVTFGFFVAAGAGMTLVYQISAWMSRGYSESVLQFYLQEISFIFTGFWAEASNTSLQYRYFYDVLLSPLFLLPSSWTRGAFEDVGDVHTELMLGAAKGEGGVTASMPIDILTMGFLQLHVVGILLYAVLFGMLLRALQNVTNSIELRGVRAAFSAYVALEIAGYALFYSHPGHVVRSNFSLIATLLVVLVVRRFSGGVPTKASASRTNRTTDSLEEPVPVSSGGGDRCQPAEPLGSANTHGAG